MATDVPLALPYRCWHDSQRILVFLSLSLFYRVAPRRQTRFAEVWVAALGATLSLKGSESLFPLYLREFASLNAVYGAFGGIVALLLWIYLCGWVVIFGACVCAAQAAGPSAPEETITRKTE
jgi:Ca2+-transporting ATPase